MPQPKAVIPLLFALGNPGGQYEDTYHNAGILALPKTIAALTGETPDALTWKSHKRLFSYAAADSFIFAKSEVFMNESGIAAAEALKKFGIPPVDLVVFHDDSDLTIGSYKISFDRSSGGHKGAQSVIDHLKTQTFTRVRLGVRPAAERRRKKAGDFVLSKIKPADRKALETAFKKIAADLKQGFEKGKNEA